MDVELEIHSCPCLFLPLHREGKDIIDEFLLHVHSFLVTTSLSLSCLVFVRNDNPLVTRKKMNGC